MENKYLKKEIKRQLTIANRMALPREKWNKNDMGYVGAYHLGRLEALEDIDSKLEV